MRHGYSYHPTSYLASKGGQPTVQLPALIRDFRQHGIPLYSVAKGKEINITKGLKEGEVAVRGPFEELTVPELKV